AARIRRDRRGRQDQVHQWPDCGPGHARSRRRGRPRRPRARPRTLPAYLVPRSRRRWLCPQGHRPELVIGAPALVGKPPVPPDLVSGVLRDGRRTSQLRAVFGGTGMTWSKKDRADSHVRPSSSSTSRNSGHAIFRPVITATTGWSVSISLAAAKAVAAAPSAMTP